MGKGQQQQRTKGNTKPSSSDRTARLLATTGVGAVNTFVGFSALSSGTTAAATTPPTTTSTTGDDRTAAATAVAVIAANDDLTIDAEVRVIFKKMSKKDCVTKVKALQEFQQHIKDKTESDVKPLLGQWPRIYGKLAIDNDWRVREATHKSHELLVSKVGRNIAPYLRQLMPIWLTTQYDNYSPAATASISAFDTAFPSTKKSDVLTFTKDSIISYIKDMLLNQTLDSVSELSATPDENKSKYQRLMSNSLQGLTALLATLSTDILADEQFRSDIKDIVGNNKFWKFAKYPDSLIRSSWFRLMASVAQYMPNLYQEFANKICGLTLGGLDERDILVAPAVWECALLSVITIDKCWENVNFKKAFYPQFRAVIREAGRGNAGILFPNLLPLLSRVPYESVDRFITFHEEFYVFMREGINKTVQNKCQHECNAIVKAYMECMRYTLSNNFISDSQQRHQFQTTLVKEQLLVLVGDAIVTDDLLAKTCLFSDLGSLWMYLTKQDNNSYQHLVSLIGNDLTAICVKQIVDYNYKTLPRISRLLVNLFCDINANKSDRKLRFRRDSDKDDISLVEKSVKNIQLRRLISVDEAVDLLTQVIIQLIHVYKSDYHKYECLELLMDLMRFQTADTFANLLTKSTEVESYANFWTLYLNEWFKIQSLNLPSSDKSRQLRTLIDITLIFLSLIDDNGLKFQILDQICSLTDPHITETLFSVIIKTNDKVLSQWLKSESAGKSLVDQTLLLIAASIDTTSSAQLQRDQDILWQLIRHCLTGNSFDRKYIEEVIDKFRVLLQDNSRQLTAATIAANSDHLVDFTCRLASELLSSYELCTELSAARELLVTIFSINLRFDDPNHQLMSAWKTGVANIVRSNGAYLSDGGLITTLALQIRSRLQAKITTLENAELVYRCASELLNIIYETNNENIDETDRESLSSDQNTRQILDLILLTDSEWQSLADLRYDRSVVHYYWLTSDKLIDTENCQMITDGNNTSSSLDTIGCPFVYSSVTTLLFLENLLKQNQSPLQLNSDLIDVIVAQMKHLFTAGAYVSTKSKFNTKKSSCFAKVDRIFRESLQNILNITIAYELNVKLGQIMLNKLLDSYDALKALTFSHYVDNYVDNSSKHFEYNVDIGGNYKFTEAIVYQIYLPLIPQNDLIELMKTSLNDFINCQEFVNLDDGISKLVVIESCLKNLTLTVDMTDVEESGKQVAIAAAATETVVTLMDMLCSLKMSNSDRFYYKNDIEPNSELQFYSVIIDMFAVIISRYSDSLKQTHWDLILCSTTSWLMNLVQQKTKLNGSLAVNLFATKLLRLIQTISTIFDDQIPIASTDKYPQNLSEEWHEFHSPNIFHILIPFYIDFIDNELNIYEEVLVNQLAKTVILVNDTVIVDILPINDNNREALPVKTLLKTYDYLCLSPEKENRFNLFCPLVVNKSHSIALSFHRLILKIIPFMLRDYIPIPSNREEEETYLSPPKTMLSLLQQTDSIVDTMLSDYRIGDCICTVESDTDSFTYTLAYLLIWTEILEVFNNLCDESRPQFTAFLGQFAYLSRLLENLFRLMPLSMAPTDIDGRTLDANCLANMSPRIWTQKLIDEPRLDSTHIQCLSSYLYYLLLRRLPASVRQWWNNCDRKTSEVVNKYTSNYFSGQLSAQELDAVQKADISQFKNMTIKARPMAREVVANYTIEEITIELLIQLPQNHPLGPVGIDSGKRIGVTGAQWRTWLLQLTTFLTHQNGSILDGLTLWKKNIDKRFEGVDECMICFYVLHGQTCQLPRLQCKYCKKRFHSACLYKWFSTSNNSTCPLCRNLF